MSEIQISQEFRTEISVDIIEALNLGMSPEEIEPDAPLYGDGLGLDSIDILEIALVVSKKFGLQIKADNPDNASIFKSLNSLCEYIIANRTK